MCIDLLQYDKEKELPYYEKRKKNWFLTNNPSREQKNYSIESIEFIILFTRSDPIIFCE